METLTNRSWMVIVVLSLFLTVSRARLVAKDSILKTIKSKGGDIIDCVDIHKQPALNHPLMANHILQMKPSWYPDSVQGKDSSKQIINWQENRVHCPQGTIPISRNKLGKKFSSEYNLASTPYNSEKAQVSIDGDIYYGARAVLSANNPKVMMDEYSHSQIWVEAGEFTHRNVVEAGWMVSHSRNFTDTRYFIHWTRDNYNITGCYNLECQGFVQTNYNISFGEPLPDLKYSTYGGKQYGISFEIHKDMKSGNWWLRIQDKAIGYWPVEIFNNGGLVSEGARYISWGGEVSRLKQEGVHTSTEMGSGHLASEGWGKAAFIRHMGYFDEAGRFNDADDVFPVVTSPECYSVSIQQKSKVAGVCSYYGGPGYNDMCTSK